MLIFRLFLKKMVEFKYHQNKKYKIDDSGKKKYDTILWKWVTIWIN